jgi:hypothetical protein
MKYLIRLLVIILFLLALLSYGEDKNKLSHKAGNKPSAALNGPITNHDTNKSKIILLKNGINYVDLNGDGIKDMIVSGFRINEVAWSLNICSFYIFQKVSEQNGLVSSMWSIVDIIDGNNVEKDKDKYNIFTVTGQEEIWSEIAIIKDKSGNIQLILASKEHQGLTDNGLQNVTFSYYSLSYEEMRYKYKLKSKSIAKHKYYNARDAIIGEFK